MKKNFFGLFALVLAVGLVTFSAFTKASNSKSVFAVVKYAVYGTGTQSVVGNYTIQPTVPNSCFDDERLCWIKVSDVNENGTIEQSEFTPVFEALDGDDDGSLDDESEVSGILEKKL